MVALSKNSKLDEIGSKYQTDKAHDRHNYLNFYDKRLSNLTGQSFTMFEIGVLKGGSLRTWGEYFSKATIVGMDVVPETVQHAGDNRHVHIGDASNKTVIDHVVSEYGRPLIVLDDGSHFWDHQISSLRHFWPHILPGGMFIMEDIQTSFKGVIDHHPEYRGSSDISAYDYIAQINRRVVGVEFAAQDAAYDGFVQECASETDTIEWYRGTCIITKK